MLLNPTCPTCPSAAELARMALRGVEVVPCAEHEPRAHQLHQEVLAAEAAAVDVVQRRAALAEVSDGWAAATAASDAEAAEADRERRLEALAAGDPILASLLRLTGGAVPDPPTPAPSAGSSLPLNAPLTSYPALAGMTTERN